MPKEKFYVVWEGREPGIYTDWEDCQEQILHFPGAKFKSFKTQEEAVEAFRNGGGIDEGNLLSMIAEKHAEIPATCPAPRMQTPSATGRPVNIVDFHSIPEINPLAWAVDGACAGNPGMMEYRGVRVADGAELFHYGPLPDGTNNVAEYLALVHALALLFRQNDSTTPIYTDSGTAVAWVRNRGCRTQLKRTERNARIFEMIARANVWLSTHTPQNPILRWNTALWGEIPADFGRK